MKTLVVMNEKGGVGKTNIVAHAGWYFAERLRTLVIDLDAQANLTTTLGAHLSPVESVNLFAEATQVPSVGSLTVARSSRDLMGVEGADRTVVPFNTAKQCIAHAG
jgi:chromosome partitioning protein